MPWDGMPSRSLLLGSVTPLQYGYPSASAASWTLLANIPIVAYRIRSIGSVWPVNYAKAGDSNNAQTNVNNPDAQAQTAQAVQV